jgi:hypothetical protein
VTAAAATLGRSKAELALRTIAQVDVSPSVSGTGVRTFSPGSGEEGRSGARRPVPAGLTDESPLEGNSATASTTASSSEAATPIQTTAPNELSLCSPETFVRPSSLGS